MSEIPCLVCGTAFPAKRSTAKYCSERCKKRAQRDPSRLLTAVPDAGQAVPLAGQARADADRGPSGPSGGVWAATLAELQGAGRDGTPAGRIALALAAQLDEPGANTGSSLASLARQVMDSLKVAMDGVQREADPLDELSARRAARTGRGA